MPLRAHHRPPRSTAPVRTTRTAADLPFDDLVYLLAAGVADAQTALDARTAETAASLAETELEVVPSITKTIDADGEVTTETAPTESRSLLELGITPAWYRFSETTIEVELDVSVTDRTDRADHTDRADRTTEFRADTGSVIDRRRFGREAGANARLAARLEPTPIPVRTDSRPGADEPRGGERAD
ncbi:hypothetical protein [Halorubrum lipolyticum]|uniref:Uncharacterized protein n=1 Tax=Halorubrum lipolyticum DSM 21995 TaxID=1227482 RepID=M0NHX8_9EURY|nr:hypothetical protein [Halorubrum lipolyticum]EMA57178.1 hypothetical protein C469_15638 [Halorubrum lipolyticum DSM 21995]